MRQSRWLTSLLIRKYCRSIRKGKDKEELKTSNQALKQAKDMKVSILVNEDQLVLQKCLQVL